jgi:hypothetical protein
MQQASRSIASPEAGNVNVFAPPPASPRFVVNLCSSTSPVGLTQPTHAGLKRFTFFVSRRLEEGRERFRLHMGYFETQEEAEKMLDLVRDVYPAAWASAAPGIKLRARAAQAQMVAATALSATPSTEAALTVAAAEPVAVTVPVEAPVRAEAPINVEAPAMVAPLAPAAVAALQLAPDLPRNRPVPVAAAAAETSDAARSLVNVRTAIDSLGDAVAPAGGAVLEGEAVLTLLTSARPAPAARIMPAAPAAPAASAAPAAAVAPTAKPVVEPTEAPIAPARAASPPRPAAPTASRPARTTAPTAPAAPRIEPALFAVQLLWSVQPIDMGQVPQLAIFSAYTLYGAEGNRDGRRWYGLRLGFFTDAVSAKQVAQYVRSEFKSVSVVPVTERERGRASAATAKPLPPMQQQASAGPELKFIDEVPTDTAASGSQPAVIMPPTGPRAVAKATPAEQAAIAAVGITTRAAPGKRAKLRVAPAAKSGGKRPRALSLEETLEILGAGDLQIDNGRGELMNDKAHSDRKQPAPSSSRFGRLINRLAERLGNS